MADRKKPDKNSDIRAILEVGGKEKDAKKGEKLIVNNVR